MIYGGANYDKTHRHRPFPYTNTHILYEYYIIFKKIYIVSHQRNIIRSPNYYKNLSILIIKNKETGGLDIISEVN